MNLSNQLFLFWKIGKKVYEDQNCYYNVIQKYSEYYSYYFGNSSLFTRERIHLMKRFYMNYPIYAYQFNSFSWDQVQILLQITNKK